MLRKQKWPVLFSTIGVLSLFSWVACIEKPVKDVLGYAPVYGVASEMYAVSTSGPQPIVNAGKIYQYQQYTFQMENGKGIHVINSSDPSNPMKVAFIKVGGCSEISIKNNILYTDNYQDLVSFNISNLAGIIFQSPVPKVFLPVNQEFPPHEGVYFECVDPSQGTVIAWTEKILSNPKCRN